MAVRLLLVLSLASAAACRQNDDPDAAVDLLARVQEEDYASSWDRAPNYPERTPSTAPHSDNVEIFVNDVVAEALGTDGLTQWPVGSIIAKDGYADDGTLEIVALMEKGDSGWFWAEYDAEGTPLYSGDAQICIDCHDTGSDFVRAFSLP